MLNIFTLAGQVSPRDGSWLPLTGGPPLSSRSLSEKQLSQSREGLPLDDPRPLFQKGEALVEMHDGCVKYRDKPALGGWKQEVNGEARQGLWWTVRRGERWGVFGPNGKQAPPWFSPKFLAYAYQDLARQRSCP